MGLLNDYISIGWQQHLQIHRIVLVDQWFRSLEKVQISFLPPQVVKPRLHALSEIIIDKLFAQHWSQEGLEELGSSLVHIGYNAPEILEATNTVWLSFIEQYTNRSDQPMFLRRLLMLLNALAVGFCRFQKAEIQPIVARRSSTSYEQLFRSDLALYKTFNAIDVGLCFADFAGHITLANRAFQKMFGYSEEELYGTSLAWFSHPEDLTVTSALFDKLRSQELLHQQFEKRYFRRDGSIFWARLNVTKLSDVEGWEPFILGIFEDITLQKQKEVAFEELKRTVATLRERERVSLARDLHDGPVQDLLAVNYQIQALLKLIAQQSCHSPHTPELANLERELSQISNYVVGSVSQLRAFIGELRPAGLLELGLPAAIEGFVNQLEQSYPLDLPTIILELDEGAVDLPEPIAINLFHVLQEALRNAVYHAQASRIVVSLKLEPTSICVMISDDGKGFAVPSDMSDLIHNNHFGLAGMFERIHTINGRYEIVSQPSQGTVVKVWVALEPGKPL
jgi:PAS domain S-box-containing protein